MSLLKITRAFIRRLWHAPKLIERPQLITANLPQRQFTSVARKKFLWGNLEAFKCNNVVAEIRRRASKEFLRRYATNFCLFSFVSVYLQENEESEKLAPLSTLVDGLKASAKYAVQNFDESASYPSKLSEYEIQKRLGDRSCHSAVYQAQYDGNECAIKIMFNYETSSSEQIFQAFKREYELLSTENAHKSLSRHPNIIALLTKFIDKMPELYDSKESYPQALPRQIQHDGYGRNQTLFLVMPKYSCTLRDYMQTESFDMTFDERVNLVHQLLEGVAHLECNNVAHRDLKSDNILLESYDDGDDNDDDENGTRAYPRLVITDFGCCFTDDTMLLPYDTAYVDRGGNLALMAPEIASAVCGRGVHLDYFKSDAWSAGSLVYEIFGHPNPFYELSSKTYSMEDLPELRSGNVLIDYVVKDLLQKNPIERLRAQQAATILFVYLTAPKEWITSELNVCEIDINRWIMELFLVTLRKTLRRQITNEMQMTLVFLGRVTTEEIKEAITYIRNVEEI